MNDHEVNLIVDMFISESEADAIHESHKVGLSASLPESVSAIGRDAIRQILPILIKIIAERYNLIPKSGGGS